MKNVPESAFSESEKPQEHCAIAGAYDLRGERNVAPHLIETLLRTQNRGNSSSGVAVFNPESEEPIQMRKEYGLVSEVFRLNHKPKADSIQADLWGIAGIGHNRYETVIGKKSKEPRQPAERKEIGRLWKHFVLGFNGTVANYRELMTRLLDKNYTFQYEDDVEVMIHEISRLNSGNHPVELAEIFRKWQRVADGCFNIVYMNAQGDLVGYKSADDFRPMVYGVTPDDIVLLASESSAIRDRVKEVVHMQGGQMVWVDGETRHFHEAKEPLGRSESSLCVEEFVYLSNANTEINGIKVNPVRVRFGEKLAEIEDQPYDEDWRVVPIPDTALSASAGFSRALDVPIGFGLLRNPHKGRTFITNDPEGSVAGKFSVMEEEVNGRKIFVIDDSIMHLNTLKRVLTQLFEEADPQEVHLRIASYAVTSPCFYGLAIGDRSTLFAAKYMDRHKSGEIPAEVETAMLKDINKMIPKAKGRVKSIKFLPPEKTHESIGLPKNCLCDACGSADYPTEYGKNYMRQREATSE